MTRRRWDGEAGPGETVPGGTTSVLVSLHYLRAALRRRWRVWVGLGASGFLLAIAVTLVVPASSASSTTMILAHDSAVEPSLAMATDLRLLQTRTVAQQVIDELDIDMTPADFQDTVKADPLTTDVLTISVYAGDDATATERAEVLTEVFMDFRAEQIEAQSDALVAGYEQRVAALQRQSNRLTQQYTTVSSNVAEDNSHAADLLAQRAQADEQIGQIQEQVAEAQLESGSIVQASRVLDEASLVPAHPYRRTALAGVSGLVGGMAVGVGLVLMVAITSDRLRRREDVSRALGVPVRSGVGHVRDPGWLAWRRNGSDRALGLLTHSLESALRAVPDRPVRTALAAVDNVDDTAMVVAALGVDLTRRGIPVLLVDLSRSGDLGAAVEQRVGAALPPVVQPDVDDATPASPGPLPDGESGPAVFRSDERAELARGPLDMVGGGPVDLSSTDPRRELWDRAAVVLTLVEVTTDGGLEALSSWADQAVPLVTAGRSSAERLQTTAELVRAAGLDLPFAVMVGCDSTDDSLGLTSVAEDAPATERSTG